MSGQTAQAFGDRNIIVQASGSGNTINISGLAHLTLISPLRNKVRPPVKDLDLLDPGVRAVPLLGRDTDLHSLRAWVESNRVISVRAVTGAGGSGKTRLALELMFELATRHESPWDTGFLSHTEARRFTAAHNLATWGWQRDTLVVIDYAASFAPELNVVVEELSQSQTAPDAPRLRVLLLERHASVESGWYRSLISGDYRSDTVRDLFDPWEPSSIQPVASIPDRYQIIQKMMERALPFAQKASPRPSSVPVLHALDDDFAQRLSDPKWADPLMLMMAALAAFETGVAKALSLSRPEMALRLAEREAARIRKFAPVQERHAADLLVHLAAVTTLCGGLSCEEGRTVAAEEALTLGLQYPVGSGAATADLQNALPALDGGLEAVRPDLIGEAFLLVAWSSGVSVQVFDRAIRRAQTNAVSVLIRTAQDFATPKEQRPVQWLAQLLDRTSDVDLLNIINDALPLQTLSLREFALRVANKLIGASEKGDRPRLLVHLSNRQSDLGRREQALAAIEEAVAIRRELAAARPDAFRPDLALSLNNLSNRQSDLGQREQALAAIEEAVAIYRELAAARPDAFHPDLARSLAVLGSCCAAMGDYDRAVRHTADGLSALREQFLHLPHALASLARTLMTQYVTYSAEIGRDPDQSLLAPYESYFDR